MRGALLAALLCVPAAASEGWLTDLAKAKAAGKPILVDFQAVWCYSCYYMEEKVLSQAAFKDAAAGLTLLKLDVDTPEGAELKKRLKVGFLPSYVLLDPSERELGRIIGEQTEADFVAKLTALRGGGVRSPAERLLAALDANDPDGAERLRRGLAADRPTGPAWERASGRLDLALALKGEDPAKAVAAFESLMRLGGGCELPYHLFRAEGALKAVPEARRRAALEAARGSLAALVEERWFGEPARRCADGRSVLEGALQAYDGLGLKAEREALLSRAADELAARLKAAGGPGNDRNLDDDARHFFQMAGRDAAVEAHLRALVDAYPSDYVYAGRLARFLSAQARYAEALPFSEKAYHLSFGSNRPGVAVLRADLLSRAGRADEAKALLRLELKAAKARFPDAVGPLEKALAQLGG